MSILDFVAGCFGILSGLFMLHNVAVLNSHKEARGVSITSSAFFAVWSIFNIYYFHTLNQNFAMIGAGFLSVGNTVYLIMLLKFKENLK